MIPVEVKIAVQETVHRFLNAVDALDFDAVAACCTADMAFDYSELFGPDAANVELDAFITDLVTFLPGFNATRHLISNFVAEEGKTDDEIRSQCAVQGIHLVEKAVWTAVATYHHQFARTDAGWHISHMRVKIGFMIGESLVELARSRVKDGQGRPAVWTRVATGVLVDRI